MTAPDLTAIGIIADRSGSMERIRTDAEGMLRQFIDDQRALPGRVLVTFARFDSVYELVHLNEPLDNVTDLTLQPRGMTALHDAIGRTIAAMGESFAAMPEDQRPGKVLVAIITDGQENASREYTRDQVFKLITEHRNTWNWEIVFLAANQDACTEGRHLGIAPNATRTFVATAAGVRAGGQSLASYAASYRTTGTGTFNDPNDQP